MQDGHSYCVRNMTMRAFMLFQALVLKKDNTRIVHCKHSQHWGVGLPLREMDEPLHTTCSFWSLIITDLRQAKFSLFFKWLLKKKKISVSFLPTICSYILFTTDTHALVHLLLELSLPHVRKLSFVYY